MVESQEIFIKIMNLFISDTMELLDHVLDDNRSDPQYSPKMVIYRLQLILSFFEEQDQKKYADVADYLLSCGYAPKDVQTLYSLCDKEQTFQPLG